MGKITYDDYFEVMEEKILQRNPQEELRKVAACAPAMLCPYRLSYPITSLVVSPRPDTLQGALTCL